MRLLGGPPRARRRSRSAPGTKWCVDVERRARVAVTEPPRDRADVNARGQQPRRDVVPEIVKAHTGDAGLRAKPADVPRDRVGTPRDRGSCGSPRPRTRRSPRSIRNTAASRSTSCGHRIATVGPLPKSTPLGDGWPVRRATRRFADERRRCTGGTFAAPTGFEPVSPP